MTPFALARRSVLAGLPLLIMSDVIKPRLTYAQMRVAETTLDIFKAEVPTHRLDDRVVTLSNGRRFRIFRATPKASPPRDGFPVLYLLDGNAVFDDLTVELLARAPDLVIIGIGYDTPRKFAMVERTLDYTPPRTGESPQADPLRPERRIGGAFEFLPLLIGELRVRAEEGIAVDASRRALGGHSFGGLMTLITLFRQPDAFCAYAPVSPSLWWAMEPMAKLEHQAHWSLSQRKRIFISLGDKEQRSNDKGPPPEGPAPETMDLIRRLSTVPVLSVSSLVLEGHVHGATLLGALPQILEWARAS